MKVEFTQFLRPDGKQVPVSFDLDADLKPLIEQIFANGMRFTAEELTTGEVSFAAEHELGDYLVTLCANGPGVPDSIAAMIRMFDEGEFKAWLKRMEDDA